MDKCTQTGVVDSACTPDGKKSKLCRVLVSTKPPPPPDIYLLLCICTHNGDALIALAVNPLFQYIGIWQRRHYVFFRTYRNLRVGNQIENFNHQLLAVGLSTTDILIVVVL